MFVVIFIIILAVLVLVHEFGHFIVAKKSGIRVDEFGLGFPPRAWGKKIGETVYSLNWIPFGGFVKIFGENPNDESLSGPESSRSFVNKNRGIQAAVLVAGIVFNIIFAWLLISVGFMAGLPASVDDSNRGQVRNPALVITEVFPESPAADAGLKPGDKIVEIRSDDASVSADAEDFSKVQNFIASNEGEKLEFEIARGKQTLNLEATPKEGVIPEKAGIGISMDEVGIMRLPIHKALFEGVKLTWDLLVAITVGLSQFIGSAFTGNASFDEVTGPVGIAGMVGDAQALGFIYLLSFTAFISLNLAVLNLVPFPALDGGRLLFVLIEAVSRRRINPKIANAINGIGFLLLILLMVVITFKDIVTKIG